MDTSKLFHHDSKDPFSGGRPIIAKNRDAWPDEWKEVQYKEYPSFERLPLPEASVSKDLIESIVERHSQRDYQKGSLPLEKLSTFLKYSCGEIRTDNTNQGRRAQASGGGRYPIEIYPIILQGDENVSAGTYHYNVKEHSLERVLGKHLSEVESDPLFRYDWIYDASVVFIMTAVFERNQMKYKTRGYRYVLMEAGHIGQNMYLLAAALGLKACALGGTNDEAVEKHLDIDGVSESVVYAVSVGV